MTLPIGYFSGGNIPYGNLNWREFSGKESELAAKLRHTHRKRTNIEASHLGLCKAFG